MNTYQVVLYIHIVSLLVGFSAGVAEGICLFRLRAARTLADAVPWGALAGQLEKAFPVAILGLYGTGAYLTSDLWTWSTSWIVMPIVGLAVLALQGPLVAGRRGHKVKEALQANGPGPLGSDAVRMTHDPALWAAAFANEGLVLAIIWVMVGKPGWAGATAAVAAGYAVGAAFGLRSSRLPSLEGDAVTEPV